MNSTTDTTTKTQPEPSQAPSSPSKYKREDLEPLFFQMDNLFHTRVNALLVCQSIFFVGAATAFSQKWLVTAVGAVGILTALLFTWTNLKLYWRVTWLIMEYKEANPAFVGVLSVRGLKGKKSWGPVTGRLIDLLAKSAPQGLPSILDTGWLFTWGLLCMSLLAWAALILASWLSTPTIPH